MQRRQRDRDYVEAVVQILAEAVAGDSLAQVVVGRRQHANIDVDQLLPAHPAHLALLQYSQQFGLYIKPHGRDLVEEDRSALSHFQQALFARVRAGKGPSLVAEEL